MVKRFRPYCWDSPVTPTVRENFMGDYVLYTDYERLAQTLRSVRSILQSDSIEYDDMRHIEAIIDDALAGSSPPAPPEPPDAKDYVKGESNV